MSEKLLEIIQKAINSTDLIEFLDLMRQKVDYIKKQPMDFLLSSFDNIKMFLTMVIDAFKSKSFMPKNTLIAVLILIAYFGGKKLKILKFLPESIDKELLVGFCIYLLEKDIHSYSRKMEGLQ